MINSHELTLFALVVEAKSFNKAAQLAGISSAALSKKISHLEKQLEVQLLHRTTRQLNLTEAGKVFYSHAKSIRAQVNDAVNEVTNFSTGLTGTIKMTVPTISGEDLLAEIVSDFCQLHPNLMIEMRLENRLVDLVKEGLDLAIRTGELSDSSLIAKTLIKSNWAVCCAPDYIKEYGEPKEIDALQDHNCLVYTNQGHYWHFRQGDREVNVHVSGNFATNNSQALRKAALRGNGIIYVSRFSVYEDLMSGRLVALLPNYTPRSLGIYAVYPYSKYQSQKMRLLIEHIKQAYQAKKERF
ncbi:MAG: LysR family transcriptional regulator [Colwellia sp.]